MPRVLIVSDSHGMTKELEMIKTEHTDQVDHMIHCGDSELPYADEPIQGFSRVAGNCDYDPDYPDDLTVDVNDLRFFVAHGHMHHVKMTLDPITYRASEDNAQIVCHGHSHFAQATEIGDQLVINPGSIRMPRGRREETYAILEWDDDKNATVRFYRLNGDEVKDLARDLKLR
ncbi:hypothetical protein SAMN05421734_103118 [Pelagirhabdus alkalitolerans]|uniref:Phosphoesterase n=1 Tax=Pelagirhabdus alkalitolerans TaxID=1612202 RepID=A0A1G6HN92_9BACI|nr:metallophosphoesterase [Pelagirhabdus alkalitolerans]SDB95355.1 hypothetical protein SAMN05421734_103118 [Pelagirhabdus alkalitolerans]